MSVLNLNAPSGTTQPLTTRRTCWQSTVDQFNVVKKVLCEDTSGAGKVAKVGFTSLQLTSYIRNMPLTYGWVALGKTLGGFAQLAEVLDTVKRLYRCAEGKAMRIWDRLHAIFFAIFRTLGACKFLDRIGVTNISGVAAKIAKIPVLGLLFSLPISVFGIAACSFNIVENSLKIREYAAERIVNNALAQQWAIKKELIDGVENGTVFKVTELENMKTRFVDLSFIIKNNHDKTSAKSEIRKEKACGKYDYSTHKLIHDNWNQFLATTNKLHPSNTTNFGDQIKTVSIIATKYEGLDQGVSDQQYLKAKVTYENHKWSKLRDNLKHGKVHSWMSIASDISKIAINLLAFVLLATTGTMIALAFVVAILSLTPAVYAKKYDINDNPSMKLPPVPGIISGYQEMNRELKV